MKLLKMVECLKTKTVRENLIRENTSMQDKNRIQTEYKSLVKTYIIRQLKALISPKTTKLLNCVDAKAKVQAWFVPDLTREDSEEYLREEQVGAFVVRFGRSKDHLALTVKCGKEEFNHYKVLVEKGEWTVVGCEKTFLSLSSMVVHLSFLKEMIPITLQRWW